MTACFGLIFFFFSAVSLTLSNRVTLNFFWVTLSRKGLTKIAYECSASSSPRTSFDCPIVRKKRLKKSVLRKCGHSTGCCSCTRQIKVPEKCGGNITKRRHRGRRAAGYQVLRTDCIAPTARSIRSAKATQRRKFARPAMSSEGSQERAARRGEHARHGVEGSHRSERPQFDAT